MVGGLQDNMMVMARVWGHQGKALLTCVYRHQRQGAENSLSVTRFVFLSFKLIFIEIEARCLFSPRVSELSSSADQRAKKNKAEKYLRDPPSYWLTSSSSSGGERGEGGQGEEEDVGDCWRIGGERDFASWIQR